ncbi:MAG: potassium transporter TrkG [Candidatus Gastranaerophilaceae bacterium]
MKRTKLKDKEVNPFKTILFGFLGYVIIGVALISLPFAQKIPVGFVDNLFNVVSAMSTTGLTTGSLSDMYTPFGKIILLGLIQLGAIGYMTLTSFLILSTSKKISTHRVKILSAEFSMPENFDLKHFISNIIIYTIIVEFIGTVLLCIEFSKLGLQKPLWSAIFHCVSAFSTAGFSILC